MRALGAVGGIRPDLKARRPLAGHRERSAAARDRAGPIKAVLLCCCQC